MLGFSVRRADCRSVDHVDVGGGDDDVGGDDDYVDGGGDDDDVDVGGDVDHVDVGGDEMFTLPHLSIS